MCYSVFIEMNVCRGMMMVLAESVAVMSRAAEQTAYLMRCKIWDNLDSF